METCNVLHACETATHAAVGDDIATAERPGTGSRTDNQCSFPAPYVADNNVVHQRRRVNPESLALRLGPDLVRDLDALITPGNTEMPSFAVRKELQERYNIDRRHIYDYFHSRGLRVVKEDKHGNPMTVKDAPTVLPNLRPLRQAPVKNSRSHPPYLVVAERKLPFKPRGVTKAKPGRPRKNPGPANPRIVLVTCETSESSESADTNDAPVSEYSPSADPTPTYVTVNPLHSTLEGDGNFTFDSAVNPLDESCTDGRAHQRKLEFEGMQEYTNYPAKLVLTDDRSISWNDTSPCSATGKGLLLPHAKPLTGDERRAIYKSMSDSLGPVQGIQECQGTYRKYMQARTKHYFEGLLSIPHYSQHPARTSTLSDRKPHLGTNEFRHWLSETRFLKHDVANGSPRLHSGHRNADVAKRQNSIDGVIDKRYRQISIPYRIPTLDELFPTPVEDLNSSGMTDSPVVRTREVTRTITHAPVANEYNAGGQLPLSAMSGSPSFTYPVITSVAETHQTGYSQFHGLSGFPGTQVKTRIPLAEIESHSRYPEHVPRVTHSGTRTDALCGGRKVSNNARVRLPSCSPRKLQMRDMDRIRTRPVMSRDTRRRTPSAAGGI